MSTDGDAGPTGAAPPPHVRAAGPGDLGTVAAIHVSSFRRTYAHLLSATEAAALDVDARASAWAVRLERGDGTLLVATRAEREVGSAEGVVGFIWVGPTEDGDDDPRRVGQVRSIHVAPDVVGGGYGRRLLAAGRERLHADGRSEATLWVVADNARALAVYRRDGWVADGARRRDRLGLPGEAAPTVEVVRLRRPLAADPRPPRG